MCVCSHISLKTLTYLSRSIAHGIYNLAQLLEQLSGDTFCQLFSVNYGNTVTLYFRCDSSKRSLNIEAEFHLIIFFLFLSLFNLTAVFIFYSCN